MGGGGQKRGGGVRGLGSCGVCVFDSLLLNCPADVELLYDELGDTRGGGGGGGGKK